MENQSREITFILLIRVIIHYLHFFYVDIQPKKIGVVIVGQKHIYKTNSIIMDPSKSQFYADICIIN